MKAKLRGRGVGVGVFLVYVFVLLGIGTNIISYSIERAHKRAQVQAFASSIVATNGTDSTTWHPSLDEQETTAGGAWSDDDPGTTNESSWTRFRKALLKDPKQRFNSTKLFPGDYSLTETSLTRIPRIVHFVFGLSQDFGGKPFGIMHYVAVKSAFMKLRPQRMFMYYTYEPTGFWWELTKPMLTLEHVEEITQFHGKPIKHVAHRADVIRLLKLIEKGGIYHDMDVITLKEYQDSWFDEEFVMAQQGDAAKFGLCNAILMSRKDAWFAKLWLNEYHNFDDHIWDNFSVRLPKDLWLQYPESIKVLSSRRMFWPLFGKGQVEMIFARDSYSWEDKYDQVAYHAWEKFSYPLYVHNLTAEEVFSKDTTFHRMIRPSLLDIMDIVKRFSDLQFYRP
eukprot:TRINITY_DN3342_c0_g1_i2.p1 TRINITY_DN3342_c0_g1~~TRINITY_DN3342_c0_g1_i2.p1  ORF type:complete len:394 (-),score=91.69 TRINITY_DN3342_c0_g1_i2:82-1263(-)